MYTFVSTLLILCLVATSTYAAEEEAVKTNPTTNVVIVASISDSSSLSGSSQKLIDTSAKLLTVSPARLSVHYRAHMVDQTPIEGQYEIIISLMDATIFDITPLEMNRQLLDPESDISKILAAGGVSSVISSYITSSV
eukprot:TRINITY_DN7286_c0_g1_i1.p1 TRINITY_DN7286_c0_g1~~TRINITY_DN7286_c0_g1_i1.p1  ORF type:complete len:138 (+),score=39.94 TRINITY_DN7286_c0_g1_i1:153-566(+)